MKHIKSFIYQNEPTVDVWKVSDGYAVDCYQNVKFFEVYEDKAMALDVAQAMHNNAIRSM